VGVSWCTTSKFGQLGRGDERVVGEIAGDGVAVRVVGELFDQRLGHALRDPAVYLAFEDQRLSTVPASSHATKRTRVTLPVSTSDLHHREVPPRGAGTEGGAGRDEFDSTSSDARPCMAAVVAKLSHDLVSAGVPGHMEGAELLVEHDVIDARFEELRRERAGAVNDLEADLLHRPRPPCCREREPNVPPPTGTRSVSPCTTSMRSISIPSSEDAIIAQ